MRISAYIVVASLAGFHQVQAQAPGTVPLQSGYYDLSLLNVADFDAKANSPSACNFSVWQAPKAILHYAGVARSSSLRFPESRQRPPQDLPQRSVVIVDSQMTPPSTAAWSAWVGTLTSSANPGGTQNQHISFTFTLTFNDGESFVGRFTQQYPAGATLCENDFIVAGVRIGAE